MLRQTVYLHRANQIHELKFFVRDGNIKYEASHDVTLESTD